VKDSTGQSLVRGKRVTGFSNTEEAAVGLTDVVPFSIEEMLRGNGGDYRRAEDWNSHVEHDGLLITGQNPASSEATAEALLAALRD
jgi:putative intracellular protease/amidase